MNIPLTIAILALGLQFATAENVKTLTGQEYKDATITRAEPDGIVLMYSAGIVKIPFTELDPEWREKYGYEPQAAAKYSAEVAAKQQALYSASQAAKNRIAAKTNALLDKQYKEVEAHKDQAAIASFSLDAHETASGRAVGHNWETNWGSYDRDYSSDKRIFVAVHDMARSSAQCDAEVYFVAETLADQTLYIYDRRIIHLKMVGGLEVKGEVNAPSLKSNVQNYAALRERYVSGAQIFGWIVIGKVGPQTFGLRASNQTLVNAVGDKKSWDTLIGDYEAAIDTSGKDGVATK